MNQSLRKSISIFLTLLFGGWFITCTHGDDKDPTRVLDGILGVNFNFVYGVRNQVTKIDGLQFFFRASDAVQEILQ